jgi:paraquat-inducible protein B
MRIYVEELRRLGLEGLRPADAELRPQIAAAGITGVKFVQFDQFPTSRHPIPDLPFAVPENYYVPSVRSTLKSFEEIANEFLDRLPTLADDVRDAVVEAKKSLRTLSDLARWAQSDETGLKSTIVAFRAAAQSFEAAVARAELAGTTKSVRDASGSVQGAAGKLAVQADQLDATLTTLREALEAVRALAAQLEQNPSALLRGRAVDSDRGAKEARP